MKNSTLRQAQGKAGFVPIILLLIAAAVLAAAGGAWWLWQKSNTNNHYANSCPVPPKRCANGDWINSAVPNCNQTCPEDRVNINNWQIYRNEKYGFEIKYPSSIIQPGENSPKEVIVEENDNPVSDPSKLLKEDFSVSISPLVFIGVLRKDNNFHDLTTYINAVTTQLKQDSIGSAAPVDITTATTSIGGKNAVAIVREAADAPLNTDEDTFIEGKDYIFDFSILYQAIAIKMPDFAKDEDPAYAKNAVRFYNTSKQILSTFKFTK